MDFLLPDSPRDPRYDSPSTRHDAFKPAARFQGEREISSSRLRYFFSRIDQKSVGVEWCEQLWWFKVGSRLDDGEAHSGNARGAAFRVLLDIAEMAQTEGTV